jgi:hypothetical protein
MIDKADKAIIIFGIAGSIAAMIFTYYTRDINPNMGLVIGALFLLPAISRIFRMFNKPSDK